MSEPWPAGEVCAAARRWAGTPWHANAALRGAGCDCVGLVRGIIGELTGAVPPAPAWRPGWHADARLPLLAALRRHLVRRPLPGEPGDVILFRVGACRAAHVAIRLPEGLIGADRRRGVVVTSAPPRRITSAWAIPWRR